MLTCGAGAVWREFTSFIKGRATAGSLSKAEYAALPAKIAPAFAGDEPRALLYALFEQYTKLLHDAQRYDLADVVASCVRQQLAAPLARTPLALHHLFVDEVQDLLQSEILLLSLAVRDPGALFLAGDTAQTVTTGVAFRFADLKAQLWAAQPQHSAPVQLRTLDVNYRSHNGIVAAAAAVAQLIERCFPNALDHVPAERGCFDGPVLQLVLQTNMDDWSNLLHVRTCCRGCQRARMQHARSLQLQLTPPARCARAQGGVTEGGTAERHDFGANQAFIVLDDAAKQRLYAGLSTLKNSKAQVFTVAESKGCAALEQSI